MTRKILIVALAVFGLALMASPAFAAKAPHRYSPKHRAKCHKTYKRVVKHKRHHRRKVFCVKVAAKRKAALTPAPPASAPAVEKTKLHSHLDPTFTRDPLNPFKVTYAYSASATQETFSAQDVRLGEEAAPLPSGVLSLFSDGKLECAINVGGSATGSECPVSYEALGQHSVTTIYTSGEQSATETETEQIDPLSSSTTLSVSYADQEGGPQPLEEVGHCGTIGAEHRCEYDYEWLLGHLTAEGGSSPFGATHLRCIKGIRCEPSFGSKLLAGTLSAPVVLKVHIFIRSAMGEHPTCEELRTFSNLPTADEAEWSYPTDLGLAATSSAPGYASSEATSAIDFNPTLPC